MGKNVFQINLDTGVITLLRDKVNEEQYISYNKKQGKYRAWDKICAMFVT